MDEATGERAVIGKLAQMTTDDVKKVLGAAKAAWSGGRGVWPQMSLGQRIDAMEKVTSLTSTSCLVCACLSSLCAHIVHILSALSPYLTHGTGTLMNTYRTGGGRIAGTSARNCGRSDVGDLQVRR